MKEKIALITFVTPHNLVLLLSYSCYIVQFRYQIQ